MKEYRFVTAGPGDVAEICNKNANDGWEVAKLWKEGHKLWILFTREFYRLGPGIKPETPAIPAEPKRGRPRKDAPSSDTVAETAEIDALSKE